MKMTSFDWFSLVLMIVPIGLSLLLQDWILAILIIIGYGILDLRLSKIYTRLVPDLLSFRQRVKKRWS